MAVASLFASVFAISILYILKRIISFLWRVQQTRKELLKIIPTLPFHWFYGHMDGHPGLTEEGLMWNNDVVSKYPRYHLFFLGPFRTIVSLNHPETIKQLTKTAEPKQFADGGGYNCLKPWIGDGLLLSSGKKWFRNRKLLTPAFHFDVLKPYVDIYNDSVEKLLNNFENESASKFESMDIFKPVGLCTLEIILRCAFSSTKDVQGKGENETYVKTVNLLGRQVFDRIMNPLYYIDFIYYVAKAGRSFRKNVEHSHKTADDVIEKRQNELKNYATIEMLAGKRHVDFLDVLLLAKDDSGKGLTKTEIRDEVETFMFEGHDTTASGISWLLYNLARHPDIQAKVRQEVDTLLEGRESDRLTWDDMNELPYLTRCIKESLRLHPPVTVIGRDLTKPLQIDDKFLPAGTIMDINIWNLHHNPTVWENPMTYDPDRFLPERIAKIDSHAFMPFSAGPRNCIGQNFAMNEMKTTAARVIRRFELSVDISKEIKMHPDVVIRSKSGIHIFFHNRTFFY